MTASTLPHRIRTLAPGVGVALVLATAATFLSEHYTAPVMLFALLLGLAFGFLNVNVSLRPCLPKSITVPSTSGRLCAST